MRDRVAIQKRLPEGVRISRLPRALSGMFVFYPFAGVY